MEKEIFDKLLILAYESHIKKLYDKKSTKFSYPALVKQLPFNVLVDFNNEHYDKYKNILLKNALIFIIKNNLEKYIDIFKGNKNELNKLINEEIIFKAKITSFAFYNIRDKFNNKEYNEQQIIDNNKELFNSIINNYDINSITNIYRKIIIGFIYTHEVENEEELLDKLLSTNKFDKELIDISNGIIKEKDLIIFKFILIRLIFSDNYLHLKSLEKEEEMDEYIDSINNDYNNDYIEEYLDDNIDDFYENNDSILTKIDRKLLNYIEDCLNKNELFLPEDYELRLNLLGKFIDYNVYIKEQEYDYTNLKNDKETIKKLKKINPIYMLDLIKTDNK